MTTHKGEVVKGKGEATKIGFPTANIVLQNPGEPGIYAGYALLGEEHHKAALYISKNNPSVIEVHVLDFEGELYGKEICVKICEKIRDDFEIADTEKLKELIANDIEMIRIELDKSDKNWNEGPIVC